jgi:hypothetical protein
MFIDRLFTPLITMTHSFGYYGETSRQIPSELAAWNLAARYASEGVLLKTALTGVPQRHRPEVLNAYKTVQKAVDQGLVVREDELEDLCYMAGFEGKSLTALLEGIGHWLHDTASTYHEQGRRDAQRAIPTAPEYTAYDRIAAQVYVAVESLGFYDVQIKAHSFERLYSVSAWNRDKNRPVMIADLVQLDEMLVMVDKWAIELQVHREMNRALRAIGDTQSSVWEMAA